MSPKGNKVKFCFGEEVRAVSLLELSYSELLSTLEALLGQPRHRLSIKYHDEENDLVSVCSEPEFQEALNCFENSSLRLIVELKDSGSSDINDSLQLPEIYLNTNSSISESVELCPVQYELEEEEQKTKFEVLQKIAEAESESFWQLPSFTQTNEGAEGTEGTEVQSNNQEVEQSEEQQLSEVSAAHEEETVKEDSVETTTSSSEESKTPVEGKKKRNGKKKRQSKKQHQREKLLSKERRKAEEREKKREAKEALRSMKEELAQATSENKEKAEELKNALKEDEEKQIELLNQLEMLEKSVAEKKQKLRLHKKESKEQLKALRKQIEVMEAEINDFKTKEADETYPVTEYADVIQEPELPTSCLPDDAEVEETIQVYQNPKKKSEGKLKLVRFDLNAQDNDYLMSQRDREEEQEHFEGELNVLASMGFKNIQRNLFLLRKFQGNIEHVVDQLILA